MSVAFADDLRVNTSDFQCIDNDIPIFMDVKDASHCCSASLHLAFLVLIASFYEKMVTKAKPNSVHGVQRSRAS